MKVFAGVLLLAIVSCSAEQAGNKEEAQIKRGLEHNNNLALLNNLRIDNKPRGEINPGIAAEGNVINVGSLNTPSGANIPVIYNTENIGLPQGNSSPLPPGLAFGYTHAYAPSYVSPAVSFTGINTLPLPYANIPVPQINNGIVNGAPDSRNIIQTYIPQEPVAVPQPYPVHLIKEVPQPYPVHITRTVQVPVQVRVPVEVPKPYEVRVPHPVPVPVHIRIPVPVVRPYPVQVTKTIAVPVEKPVYIRVPHPVQVPVPQPYPVPVPQAVQIRVPYPIILRGPEGPQNIIPSQLTHLNGGLHPNEINTALSGSVSAAPGLSGVPESASTPILITPPPPTASLPPAIPTTVTPKPQVVNPSIPPITGNGLLPPHPDNPNYNQNLLSGLLNSYVGSKEGGVYRREANQYQTAEYQKTW